MLFEEASHAEQSRWLAQARSGDAASWPVWRVFFNPPGDLHIIDLKGVFWGGGPKLSLAAGFHINVSEVKDILLLGEKGIYFLTPPFSLLQPL